MIVLYVLIQIEPLGIIYCIHTLAVIRVKCMYLEITDVHSYSHLSIVDIVISLISLSDVNVLLYSTRVFNSTD